VTDTNRAPDSSAPGEKSRTPVGLNWALVAGFLAWGTDLAFSYVLEQHSCSTGRHYLMHLISLICFGIAVSGSISGFSEFRRLLNDAEEEGGSVEDRVFFQSLIGVGFSLAFAVTILAAAVPRWILSPCD
jgi:hypothetical protein